MTGRVVIISAGSRGDVQPCVALGKGLAARGNAVTVISADSYAGLVRAAGLDHRQLSIDPAAILDTDEGRQWLAGGRDPVRFILGLRRIVGPVAVRLLDELVEGCRGADLLVGPTLGRIDLQIADHLGIPGVAVHFQPSEPTGAFAHPFVPWATAFGPVGNRLSYHLVDQATWQVARPILNGWRRTSLGRNPLPVRGPRRLAQGGMTLCCFSRHVVPPPRDWPRSVRACGYWFLDEPEWRPPESLADFLAAGPPPVYAGFGSMTPGAPGAPHRGGEIGVTVLEAVRRAGLRAVLSRDLLPPGTMAPHDVHLVEDVPHSWLFPRVAAVVHHGGAGTTAAALRAGVPSVVCPFFGDQPYWAERVTALGVGTGPLPIRRLTAGALAEALRRATTTPAIRANAAVIGRRVRAEDGVERACDALAPVLS